LQPAKVHCRFVERKPEAAQFIPPTHSSRFAVFGTRGLAHPRANRTDPAFERPADDHQYQKRARCQESEDARVFGELSGRRVHSEEQHGTRTAPARGKHRLHTGAFVALEGLRHCGVTPTQGGAYRHRQPRRGRTLSDVLDVVRKKLHRPWRRIRPVRQHITIRQREYRGCGRSFPRTCQKPIGIGLTPGTHQFSRERRRISFDRNYAVASTHALNSPRRRGRKRESQQQADQD